MLRRGLGVVGLIIIIIWGRTESSLSGASGGDPIESKFGTL